MRRQYKIYLDDIVESIEKIQTYTQQMDFEAFCRNPLVIDAVARNLEIIGEAAKKIPPAVRKLAPEIEWKKMAGVRDILIHEYFAMNLRIVWGIVDNKLPVLYGQITKLRLLEPDLFGE
jgi:uncharacterized protein with HEPN domain